MSQQLFTKSVIKKAMESKCWVYRKGNKYRVVPRSSNHGKYELSVSWNGDVPEVTSCTDWRTGEGCKGFTYSKQCYHAFSLLRKLVLYRLQAQKKSSEMRKKILAFPSRNEAPRSAVAGS